MIIAVDAMGGDYAPEAIVSGAVLASRELDCEIVLVGDEERIKAVLAKEKGWDAKRIRIHHAGEVVQMDEHPADAVRQKKESSVVVAMRLVREGACDAVLSAGSTGAAVAAAQLILKRIKGIKRPSIATPIPTPQGATLMLDSGANVDSKPIHLLQSALMGSIYSELVFGHKEPRVGLLNIGEEETKGDELARETFPQLKTLGERGVVRFIGNAEGRDIPKGNFDVVVCDGFVGNALLKFGEGLAKTIVHLITDELKSAGLLTKLGALLVKPALAKLGKRLDVAEYGGAPLLGVNGCVIISHGSSNAKAIKNAIRVANDFARSNALQRISDSIVKEEMLLNDIDEN
ncbi:MAG: phosphate acyltransferase PlsX [Schwartzia sp.]|nr:phosphate acyltransferase PlsX [Schwartzia sp. (in: firmicutes)]